MNKYNINPIPLISTPAHGSMVDGMKHDETTSLGPFISGLLSLIMFNMNGGLGINKIEVS